MIRDGRSVVEKLKARTIASDAPDGCFVWSGAKTDMGYGEIRDPITGKDRYAHRIAYESAYGAIPPGFMVCHRCDNPACVRPDHLFLGTQKDNMRDARTKGRTARPPRLLGVSNPKAKLNECDVRAVRAMLAQGARRDHVAGLFGVHLNTIGAIARGEHWAWMDRGSEVANDYR